MAELLATPHCEVSGLPLPVLPLRASSFGARFVSLSTNEHHHFHPKRSPDLETMGGIALRTSRIQKLPIPSHTEYHKVYQGPALPVEDETVFRLTVLSAAGVVPRKAIDPREPQRIVGLTDSAHAQIGQAIRVERPYYVARYFADYCSRAQTDEQQLEQLLDVSVTPDQKIVIARSLLEVSIESALGDMMSHHAELKKERMIRPKHDPTFYAAIRRLIRRHALHDYVQHLELRYAS